MTIDKKLHHKIYHYSVVINNGEMLDVLRESGIDKLIPPIGYWTIKQVAEYFDKPTSWVRNLMDENRPIHKRLIPHRWSGNEYDKEGTAKKNYMFSCQELIHFMAGKDTYSFYEAWSYYTLQWQLITGCNLMTNTLNNKNLDLKRNLLDFKLIDEGC